MYAAESSAEYSRSLARTVTSSLQQHYVAIDVSHSSHVANMGIIHQNHTASCSTPDRGMATLNCSNSSQSMQVNEPINGENLDMYNSPYSPEDSSYSENSDYTSDEYEDEINCNNDISVAQEADGVSTSHLASTSTVLPSFPTIALPPSTHMFDQNYHPSTNFVPLPTVNPVLAAQNQYVLNQQPNYHYPIFGNHSGQQYTANPTVIAEITNTPILVPSPGYSMSVVPQFTDISQSIAPKIIENYTDNDASHCNSEETTLLPILHQITQHEPSVIVEARNNVHDSEQSSIVDVNDEPTSQHVSNGVDESGSHQNSVENEEENFGEIIKKTMVETVSV